MAKYDRYVSWGYVETERQEWLLRVSLEQVEYFRDNFNRITDLLSRVIPSLKQLHQLEYCSLHSGIPSEAAKEGKFTAETIFDIELAPDTLDGLVPALQEAVKGYSRFFIDHMFIYLSTWVLTEKETLLIPNSANLYLGINHLEFSIGEKVKTSLIYETQIDVWRKNTIATDVDGMDNTKLAEQNRPRLRAFIQALEEAVGVPFDPPPFEERFD